MRRSGHRCLEAHDFAAHGPRRPRLGPVPGSLTAPDSVRGQRGNAVGGTYPTPILVPVTSDTRGIVILFSCLPVAGL